MRSKLLAGLMLTVLSAPSLAFIKLPELPKTESVEMTLSLSGLVGGLADKVTGAIDDNLDPENAIYGTGKIYSVVDGDTVWMNVSNAEFARFSELANTEDKKKALNYKYKSVKFRIGGIDTQESVHRDSKRNTVGGKHASNYLKGWAEKKQAKYRCYDHGKYGRPICYVQVNGYDIGYEMIKAGHSEYVTSFGRHPYYDKEYRSVSK